MGEEIDREWSNIWYYIERAKWATWYAWISEGRSDITGYWDGTGYYWDG